MPRSIKDPPTGDLSRIKEGIARAAHAFTQELLLILGSSTLAELAELKEGRVVVRFEPERIEAALAVAAGPDGAEVPEPREVEIDEEQRPGPATPSRRARKL